MHKSDLLTYSRFTRMPTTDEGPDVLSFGLHSVSNILRVLGFIAGLGRQACASEWPFATFSHPKVSSFIHRRSWPSSLCFRVTIRYIRPPEGELLHSLHILGGVNYPSGTLAPQYRGPADRLGNVFESGINLRALSRRSNPQHAPISSSDRRVLLQFILHNVIWWS